ncbi:hypothetical protein H4W31_006613 [Plantactinospora soyae]|uniref:Uncharacterized protein n=1 Tax=Plantactinospora soyae TaxID=1544732 RepID=A0A927MH01_9ACTN|nr:hypothetical protein [Plantactinospora soyae]
MGSLPSRRSIRIQGVTLIWHAPAGYRPGSGSRGARSVHVIFVRMSVRRLHPHAQSAACGGCACPPATLTVGRPLGCAGEQPDVVEMWQPDRSVVRGLTQCDLGDCRTAGATPPGGGAVMIDAGPERARRVGLDRRRSAAQRQKPCSSRSGTWPWPAAESSAESFSTSSGPRPSLERPGAPGTGADSGDHRSHARVPQQTREYGHVNGDLDIADTIPAGGLPGHGRVAAVR